MPAMLPSKRQGPYPLVLKGLGERGAVTELLGTLSKCMCVIYTFPAAKPLAPPLSPAYRPRFSRAGMYIFEKHHNMHSCPFI